MGARWRLPCVLCVAATIWLVWAFPRLHPAARLGLAFGRDGYLANAARIAAAQHVNVNGWRNYAKLETLQKNQELRIKMPEDHMAKDFPNAKVDTNFLPRDGGTGARLALRPDARPLSWKLPVTMHMDMPDKMAASGAMHQMAGSAAPDFAMTTDGVSSTDGMTFKWRSGGSAPDKPALGIETSVINGFVQEANTVYTMPESLVGNFDSFVVARVILSSTWTLILLFGLAFPLLREGAGGAARAMKERSSMVLGVVVGVFVLLSGVTEWDDEMISVPAVSGITTEILSLVFGAFLVGLLLYGASAVTSLNARWHPASVRGFRLLGTRAFMSRTIGRELLGGWLLAPLVVSLPLLVSATLRVPSFGGYEDGVLLNRAPVLDALLNASTQEISAMVAWAGILIPLAIRFSRPGWMRWSLMAIISAITFAMLESPFRESVPANLLNAGLNGIALVWLYSRFGMLGALSGHCSARVVTAAGSLLVQPAPALHNAGWEILLAFAGLGVVCLAAAWKGPEVVAELYGESNVRIQARSRREELLAEFNVARSAQQQMLPSEPPALEGYTIAASCQPAREVGGDLYDFLPLSDGRWGIGVADVSGKGVPAALYMTLTKGLLCAAAQDSGDPRQILSAVNKHLRTVTKRKMFVTMALGVLDPPARRMDYVRAGHNPVVWRRAAAHETRWLSGPGIGLGIAGPALFAKTLTTETLDLSPGDALIFYSDGLTEAMNSALEQFGDERLAGAVERTDGMQATATRDSILGEVRRFLEGGHSQDDLTIAVLRVNSDQMPDSNGR